MPGAPTQRSAPVREKKILVGQHPSTFTVWSHCLEDFENLLPHGRTRGLRCETFECLEFKKNGSRQLEIGDDRANKYTVSNHYTLCHIIILSVTSSHSVTSWNSQNWVTTAGNRRWYCKSAMRPWKVGTNRPWFPVQIGDETLESQRQ